MKKKYGKKKERDMKNERDMKINVDIRKERRKMKYLI